MTLPSECASRSCWFSKGELVDGADEGEDVGAELGEFLVLVGDGLPEPGDGGAEPGLVLVMHAGFLDPVVELVLQVGVPLGEGVAGTPASMASATMVRAPLERSGLTARMRSIAARIRSRSPGSAVTGFPSRGW